MPPGAADERHWEEDTLPLSRPLTDTLELPTVAAVPLAAPAPPPAAPVPAKGRKSRAGLSVALVLVLLAAGIAAGLSLSGRGSDAGPAAGTSVAIQDVSSVDPSGGSGWRRSGGPLATAEWRTQHYRSATFGGLKTGVGLLIDLGAAHTLASVRTDVGVRGTSVELRAGDSANRAPESFRLVDRRGAAHGSTNLDAGDGGKHRYWLVWVPRLGRDGNGYAAELRGISARG